MGDGDYMYAFQNVVMPVATEFDPDFVIGKPRLKENHIFALRDHNI